MGLIMDATTTSDVAGMIKGHLQWQGRVQNSGGLAFAMARVYDMLIKVRGDFNLVSDLERYPMVRHLNTDVRMCDFLTGPITVVTQYSHYVGDFPSVETRRRAGDANEHISDLFGVAKDDFDEAKLMRLEGACAPAVVATERDQTCPRPKCEGEGCDANNAARAGPLADYMMSETE